MVHGRNVAARSDFDLLARFDREWRQRVCFGANLVSGDGADGVHQPGVISDFSLVVAIRNLQLFLMRVELPK